ncbi:MAG: DNA repair protein RecN [Anaerolineae bacterium]
MLRELHIKDFAIVDELHLTLGEGLNILTGETGAGKSILIDAVALLLGERADTSAIRTGSDSGRIEGMFILPANFQRSIGAILEREGLEGDTPDILWLARELRSTGRTVARVNGRAVTVSQMREIASGLVDIHGQSEHLSLLRVREHLNLLDRFGELNELRDRVAEIVQAIRKIRRQLNELLSNERERMQRIDLLRFQVEEIRSADLKPGEKAELETELARLTNAEQLVKLATGILTRLEEGQDRSPAVLDVIGRSQRDMSTLARIDASLEPQMRTLDEITYQIEDLARTLADYIADVEFNPKRQRWVEDRLHLLRNLERKYGGDLEEVLAYAEEAAVELESLEHSDERIAELQERESELLKTCAEVAVELSRRRQEAASRLTAAVEDELDDLRMEGARLGVLFKWEERESGLPLDDTVPGEVAITTAGSEVLDSTKVRNVRFGATGMDNVEFLVAPNVGEGLKSLSQTASGGETSRLMLALKTVLSRADQTPTLIFDEIDQGIGGRIGAVVGTKLWQLTASNGKPGEVRHQVLCVTHLPQLAGFGDVHFKVLKEVVDERTVTRVASLETERRVTELAQMLGTYGVGAEQGAREILEQAEALKSAPSVVR